MAEVREWVMSMLVGGDEMSKPKVEFVGQFSTAFSIQLIYNHEVGQTEEIMAMLMSPTSIPGSRIRPPSTPPGRKLPAKKRRKSNVVTNKTLKRNSTVKRTKRVSK